MVRITKLGVVPHRHVAAPGKRNARRPDSRLKRGACSSGGRSGRSGAGHPHRAGDPVRSPSIRSSRSTPAPRSPPSATVHRREGDRRARACAGGTSSPMAHDVAQRQAPVPQGAGGSSPWRGAVARSGAAGGRKKRPSRCARRRLGSSPPPGRGDDRPRTGLAWRAPAPARRPSSAHDVTVPGPARRGALPAGRSRRRS